MYTLYGTLPTRAFPTTNEALKDYTKRLRARPAYATLFTRIQSGD